MQFPLAIMIPAVVMSFCTCIALQFTAAMEEADFDEAEGDGDDF